MGVKFNLHIDNLCFNLNKFFKFLKNIKIIKIIKILFYF